MNPGRNAAMVAFASVALGGILTGAALDRYVLFLWSRPTPSEMRAPGPRGGDGRFGPPPGRGGPRGGGRGRGGEFGPGGSEMLARELELSAAQRTAIDSLMESQAVKLNAARERIRPQMDSVLAETQREVEKRLTPAQQTKYRELRTRMRPPGGRGGGPPGGGGRRP